MGRAGAGPEPDHVPVPGRRRPPVRLAGRPVIKHPEIGDITVDCDVLNDSDTDLKIVIYTAAPGSEDAAKLDLARVAASARADRLR